MLLGEDASAFGNSRISGGVGVRTALVKAALMALWKRNVHMRKAVGTL